MKLIIFSILFSYSAFGHRVQLTSAELVELKKGEQIVRVENIKDEVFPKVTIISIISHTPKQNMEVFSDFENHKNFIPGLVKSQIVKKNKNQTDVAFELHMPMPVSNSEYTTRHTINEESGDYILKWDLVKSKQIKASKGTVMFETLGDKTLFTYINHITPNSRMAWIVKDKVVPDVKKNVNVVIKHLEKTIQN